MTTLFYSTPLRPIPFCFIPLRSAHLKISKQSLKLFTKTEVEILIPLKFGLFSFQTLPFKKKKLPNTCYTSVVSFLVFLNLPLEENVLKLKVKLKHPTHPLAGAGSTIPMPQRRCVPAVRDFPGRCGPSSSRMGPQPNPTATEQPFQASEDITTRLSENADTKTTVSTTPRVPSLRDFPPLCGPRRGERDESKQHAFNEVKKNNESEKTGFTSQRVSVSTSSSIRDSPPPLCKPRNADTQNTECRFRNATSNRNDREKAKKKIAGVDKNTLLLPGSNDVARKRVRSTLRLFHALCRSLVKNAGPGKGVSLRATRILQDNERFVNTGKPILGIVPGVEVGDEFQYWRELNIVGLHRQVLRGIDYVKYHNGMVLATSIVSSGSYDDEMENTDELVYTGQGGNVIKSGTKREPKDQKLVGGNLALKNSFDVKNPVRVILKSGSKDGGGGDVYAYYGLYEVEEYWQELGSHGRLVYKFRLCRMPGQAEVAWSELRKSKSLKTRKGLCVVDISYGKEAIPVCVINTVDDEGIPLFEYTTRMVYPNWCDPIVPVGCDCVGGCSDSKNCSCAARNGGRIPFNWNKAIMAPKSIVYECGPSCKCPPTCINRVSQHGIKFKLEIFRTKTKGWGVRSHNTIPSGSFICEYTGEVLKDEEAEKRIGNDEYLFDIGNNHSDKTLWEELSIMVADAEAASSSSSSSRVFEDGGFTIDAAHFGNVARFINHSCSPNLFAQNVLYDHDDSRIPHIMLFAGENIPRMHELTYHYNYKIDQVYDTNGNVKKKNCYCGALECNGRMY